MAVDKNIYSDEYSWVHANSAFSDTEYAQSVITSTFCIKDLVHDGKLTYDSVWNGSNCYAGFDPSLNGTYVGAAVHSVMYLDPDRPPYSFKADQQQYHSIINYRLAMCYSTSSSNNVAGLGFTYNWGVKGSVWQTVRDKYVESATTETYTFDNPYASGNGTYTYNGAYSSMYRLYPITSMPFHDIVLYPQFIVTSRTLTFSADDPSIITNVGNAGITYYNYKDFKPETEESPQGTNYDNDLWTFGYKIEDIDDTHKRLRRVEGISIATYIGHSVHAYTGSGASESYNTQDGKGSRSLLYGTNSAGTHPSRGTTNYTNGCLTIVAETYSPYTDSVLYSYVPGIRFGNNSTSTSTPGNNLAPSMGQYTYKSDLTGLQTAIALNPLENAAGNAGQNSLAITYQQNAAATGVGSTHISDQIFIPPYDRVYNYVLEGGMIYYYSTQRTINAKYIGDYYPASDLWATVASFGMYTAASQTAASMATTGIQADSPYLYLGHMDASGITDGTFVYGKYIAEEPQSEWDDPLADTPYAPVNPVPDPGGDDTDKDGSDTGTITPAGSITLGATNGFVTYYALAASQVRAIGANLWGSISPSDVLSNFFYYQHTEGSNFELSYAEILDYIVGLKYFPFNIPSYATVEGTGEQGIRIGRGTTLIQAGPILTTDIITSPIAVIPGGTCTVPSYYGTYMDHEPIAVASVYVPFCGTMELELSAVTAKQLTLTYYTDLVTGCCIAIIEASGLDGRYPIAQLNGVMGFDLMLTGNNHNQQLANIVSTIGHTGLNAASSLTSAITGAISSDASQLGAGLAGTATGIASTAIDMPKTASLHPMTVGTTSSLAALAGYRSAYIQIKRKNSITPSNYSTTVGYITNHTYSIGALSGWTLCVNPDLTGIAATAREIDMIKNLLETGFYA